MQILRVIARLLEYPNEDLQAARDVMMTIIQNEERLALPVREALVRCVEHCCDVELMTLQEDYVGMFERGRSLSLLLFEHVHGESRDRGQAMVDLMEQYTAAGLEIDARELPDHLPLFLEYLSTRTEDDARNWLEDIHHILSLLAERLRQRESVYEALFEALLEISGHRVDREELAGVVAGEERDDTPEALDKVWEEEMVKFLDDHGKSCASSSVADRKPQDQIQRVRLSDELMQDAMKQQIGGA